MRGLAGGGGTGEDWVNWRWRGLGPLLKNFLDLFRITGSFGFTSFGEVLHAAGAARAGQTAGDGANVDLDQSVGDGKGGVVGIVFEKIGHDLRPDRGGSGHAGGNATHGGIVIVADPSGNKIVWGIADGPVVSKIVAGAGFYCCLERRKIENRTVTKGGGASEVVGKNVIHEKSGFRFENGFGLARQTRKALVKWDDFAGDVFDFDDGIEWDLSAVVGEGAIDDGHIDHFYFGAAESQGQSISLRFVPGGDAHVPT